MEIIILILSGIIGGFIAGLLGLGGGIFYIIILPYVLQWYGISQEHISGFIVANSLFGITFASATSLISEFKNLQHYWKESLFLGIPAVIASILTTYYIVHSEWYSIKVFSLFVVILMLYILIQLRIKRNRINQDKRINILPAGISGCLSGIVSALSGLGGGIIIIPLLQLKFKQSVKKAKLISLVVIFLSSFFISIQNLISDTVIVEDINIQWGYILPIIVAPIILGVFIGSPIGVYFSNKTKDSYLNTFFSLFVFIVLIEKLLILFK